MSVLLGGCTLVHDVNGDGDDVGDDQVYESSKRTVLRGGCSLLCIHSVYYTW